MKRTIMSIEQQIEACKFAAENGDEAASVKFGCCIDTLRKLRKRHGFRSLSRAPKRHGGGQKKRAPFDGFED